MIKNIAHILFIFFFTLTSCNSGDNKTVNREPIDSLAKADTKTTKTILFFGNSLTAGLGVEPDEAFPAIKHPSIQPIHFQPGSYVPLELGESHQVDLGQVLRQLYQEERAPKAYCSFLRSV